ncbi:MAG: ABC transporter substrate-binding protein [Bacillota bacterium]|nr:ABC transporter substrate-binding protein [Bacillota bacterium]
MKREGLDKPIVLGFFQDGVDNEWKLTVSNSIKDSANENGIDLQFTDAQLTQENQIKAIRKFIKDKVDVIAFTPIVSSGWETVLAEAKEAGIPVILVDRFVKDDSLWTAWIGNDQVEEGRKAARWLVEYMNIIGKGNGKINVVELEGAVGSEVAIERKTGFEEIIKNYPNYAIKMSLNCGFTRELGKNVMEEFLINDGHKIDVVFAQNDEMAIGAIEAIEEYGLRPGKDIIIVSIDAGKDAFKTMMAAKLNCTVECSPVMGPKLMEAVKDLVNGKKIPKKIYVPEDVFPMENAARIYPTRKY